jgi:hypothetical protein
MDRMLAFKVSWQTVLGKILGVSSCGGVFKQAVLPVRQATND